MNECSDRSRPGPNFRFALCLLLFAACNGHEVEVLHSTAADDDQLGYCYFDQPTQPGCNPVIVQCIPCSR
jgi:hypothetical protein